jgi:hypothetical protein
VESLGVKPLSRSKLVTLLVDSGALAAAAAPTTVLSVSARHPYGQKGYIDVLEI